ncbi:O-methyltransferase-domain-containing protein [Pyronema domesticum]|uniref:Similar to Sterigmatocystin 8-O-methyltransferase acc. no. Q12120 n=1 Tax=Pyronema omphalodes (strain CBS 100304) TaxID=1076935 RepID=U4L479_PYROM|nr:O-methyltransferase-domain-containing protein [Pyronema domesticum]CCX11100.1 Similar to Sterigmatocystin 8-O-methyltransferase; acc. no. Q12120 [Pyronema omphalodes CBS 100304]
MSTPSLTQLAADVAKHAKILQDYIDANNLPQPAFDKDAPLDFPVPNGIPEQDSRIALLEAAKALHDLAVGPTSLVMWAGMNNKFDCVSLRAFDRYNIPEAVALEGETSFASIAEKTGLDEDFVSRIIRFASTNRVFRETRPGWCIHTAASRAMIENRGMRQFLGVMSDEVYEASAKVNAAEDLYHDSGEADETAFQMACNTKEVYWHYLGLPGNESKKQRFAEGMGYLASHPSAGLGETYAAEPLVDGYDWSGVGDGLMVDIGGSGGHICQAIAKKHKNLRFIVQDLESVVSDAKVRLANGTNPDDSRIEYMAHNFLEPQPVQGADIYFLRFILHDWSDKYASMILRQIAPAMKKGSKIVVNDIVLPGPNEVPSTVEKIQRSLDLSMMIVLNGKERTRSDWENLVAMADPRLKILSVSVPGALGIVEIGLKEDA